MYFWKVINVCTSLLLKKSNLHKFLSHRLMLLSVFLSKLKFSLETGNMYLYLGMSRVVEYVNLKYLPLYFLSIMSSADFSKSKLWNKFKVPSCCIFVLHFRKSYFLNWKIKSTSEKITINSKNCSHFNALVKVETGKQTWHKEWLWPKDQLF